MSKLRDNQALFDEVENIIWRVRLQGGGAREPAKAILDAIEAHLAQGGPASACTEFYGGTHCVFCQEPRGAHGENLHFVQRMADNLAPSPPPSPPPEPATPDFHEDGRGMLCDCSMPSRHRHPASPGGSGGGATGGERP